LDRSLEVHFVEEPRDGSVGRIAVPDFELANSRVETPGRGFFAILRLYGPTEAAIDKTWKPGDFTSV